MHPRLREITDLLARERAELLAAVDSVPAERREQRATVGGWSVAEVLEHLRLVEAGSAGLLARRTMRARDAGVGADPDTSSVLGRVDDMDISDSPAPRIAPEIVRPGDDVRAEDALAGLMTSRAALLDVIAQLEQVDASRVLASHAALGELDAYQWLLFIAHHERRHARQIAQIGAAVREG